MRWLGLAVAGALATGGCTLFDGDPPDRSCRTDNDCFRAQGERCDQDSKVCVVIDAGAVTATGEAPGAPGEEPTEALVDDPAAAAEVAP